MKYLYFIKLHNFVKIGVTYSIEERIYQFNIGCPYSYEIFSSYMMPSKYCHKFEKILHKRFAYLNHKGEWFNFTPELEDYISTRIMRDIELFLLRLEV